MRSESCFEVRIVFLSVYKSRGERTIEFPHQSLLPESSGQPEADNAGY